jgi:hypothetical protein
VPARLGAQEKTQRPVARQRRADQRQPRSCAAQEVEVRGRQEAAVDEAALADAHRRPEERHRRRAAHRGAEIDGGRIRMTEDHAPAPQRERRHPQRAARPLIRMQAADVRDKGLMIIGDQMQIMRAHPRAQERAHDGARGGADDQIGLPRIPDVVQRAQEAGVKGPPDGPARSHHQRYGMSCPFHVMPSK